MKVLLMVLMSVSITSVVHAGGAKSTAVKAVVRVLSNKNIIPNENKILSAITSTKNSMMRRQRLRQDYPIQAQMGLIQTSDGAIDIYKSTEFFPLRNQGAILFKGYNVKDEAVILQSLGKHGFSPSLVQREEGLIAVSFKSVKSEQELAEAAKRLSLALKDMQKATQPQKVKAAMTRSNGSK